MTTHVFIVNEETFPLHLKYMFAGTGAGDLSVDFNGSTDNNKVEKNLVSMLTDAARVRKDDKIIFYCTGTFGKGHFYGVFKAKDRCFIDAKSEATPELSKKLTFRVLLEPDEVYAQGVTEWEALDSLEGVEKPCDILWSLIYRKLDGNRGNTMITPAESERLISMIRAKNDNTRVAFSQFSYDKECKVITEGEQSLYNSEFSAPIDIKCKLIHTHYAYEAFLQTYIAQSIDIDKNLKELFLEGKKLGWLGNEVMCGVGMRRIDILLLTTNLDTHQTILAPIELKACTIYPEITDQIERYILWIKQYFQPTPTIIEPAIIVRKTSRKTKRYFESIDALKKFNEMQGIRIRYLAYQVEDNDLHFEEIDYETE